MSEKKNLALGELLLLDDEETERMLRAAVDAYGEGDLSRAETILVGLITLAEDDSRPKFLVVGSSPRDRVGSSPTIARSMFWIASLNFPSSNSSSARAA